MRGGDIAKRGVPIKCRGIANKVWQLGMLLSLGLMGGVEKRVRYRSPRDLRFLLMGGGHLGG